MVSVANISVNTESTCPALALDSCITRLKKFQDCKVSGMMFGCAQSLLTLIPSICKLGQDRILEEKSGHFSFDNFACYKALQSKIESWQEPLPTESDGQSTKDVINAGRLYKEAILIFLHTSFYASNVGDPELLALIDMSLYNAHSFYVFESDSPVLSVLLWPCMIIGSCLRQPGHREHLRDKMLETPFNMTVVQNSVKVLEWLWEDSDSNAYGPYGLGIVMRKHGVMHSMS
jgi:Fungal specific transcription factor domain